jgi:hypothetical protein
MITPLLKFLVPKREMMVPVLRGPFRGAKIRMVPHDNLRKMFGLYEHELNDWLEGVLPRVDTVLDVGGNNGYFTFGCAAAFRRMQKCAKIYTYEPQASHCALMRSTLVRKSDENVQISIEQCFVGKEKGDGVQTLDTATAKASDLSAGPTLIKIDVEGAELDVIDGASKWLKRENYFLIEVHRADYLDLLQKRFAAAGLRLEQRNQRYLPILGREHREEANWWLVTPLAN